MASDGNSEGVLYGHLIDLFMEYGDSASLFQRFVDEYPHVYVGRADRFYRTVSRIVAPCMPSILGGKVTLTGESLEIYRKKIWIPRIRNLSMSTTNL